jgi:hypothetical protein
MWKGNFAKGCTPFGYRDTKSAAELLGVMQLDLWELMMADVVDFMTNPTEYVISDDSVAHLLKIDKAERKAASSLSKMATKGYNNDIGIT